MSYNLWYLFGVRILFCLGIDYFRRLLGVGPKQLGVGQYPLGEANFDDRIPSHPLNNETKWMLKVSCIVFHGKWRVIDIIQGIIIQKGNRCMQFL